MKWFILRRRIIQFIIALGFYFGAQYFKIPLLYIIIFGSALGLIFGKVFCRWMCPIGFLMEIFLGLNPNEKSKNIYNYHKLGCPIAWVSGLLNRISLFTIKRDIDLCNDCGKCDKDCYVTTFNKDLSLYKNLKKSPEASFSCSRCLECVTSCPTGSLSFGVRTKKKQKIE